MAILSNYTVIGISGKRGSGKDTLAAQMAPFGWKKISFAAELKERCRRDFNLTEEQTDGVFKEAPTQYKRQLDGGFYTPRDIMIRCGYYYRSIDSLYWVKLAYKKMEMASRDGFDPCRTVRGDKKFVITDVRFKNEADYIKSQGGILVRLERAPDLNIYKGSLDDPSETELDHYEGFDHRIDADKNVDIKDLQRVAVELEGDHGLI